MRLSTLRIKGATCAVRQDNETLIEIDGYADVGALLQEANWEQIAADASGTRHAAEGSDLAAVVPRPGKIICVGLNYRNHILEMGRDLPEYPTLFAKYAEALIGAHDDIRLPPESESVDWEAELAVVISKSGRRVSEEQATDHIAGYSILNDVTMRDYQYRTMQWLQGKTWEDSTPFGPALVTTDEFTPGAKMTSRVDGEIVQETATDGLVFNPAQLVTYISTIITLQPGDVIASGTPGGVGHARKPPRYLESGSVLETSIEGLGAQKNRTVPAG